MKTLKYILLFIYAIIFKQKVAIVRDLNLKHSFLYRDNIEADFIVKENCDASFNFISKPDISIKGFEGQLLKNGLILMIVDLKSVFKNKVLTVNEKSMILKSFFNKDKESMVCY